MRIESSNVYQPAVGKASEKVTEKETQSQAVELSAAQKKPTKEEALQKKIQAGQTMLAHLQQQLQAANEQAEKEDEAAEKQLKCSKIADRLLSGDKVSSKDLQYLMKNDPGLYSRAIMMRIFKESPQKAKQITDDDDLKVVTEFGSRSSTEQSYTATGDASSQETSGTMLDIKV